jgi:hypothetical protein
VASFCCGILPPNHSKTGLKTPLTSRPGRELCNGGLLNRVLQKREQNMSKCGAGECDCECSGNKGCGCWASSDDPGLCDCHCYGTAFGAGQSLPVNALVDVSISGLPLLDAAKFLNSFHSEQVLVPTDLLNKLNKRVNLKVKRTRLSDVVKRLGLVTSGHRRKKKTKRK